MTRWVVVLGLAAVAACARTPDIEPPVASRAIEATVRFVDLEGGCWALEADDGTRYQPMNLPDSFRRDDLRVRVVLSPRDDVMGFCQLGPIVEVESIERAGDGE